MKPSFKRCPLDELDDGACKISRMNSPARAREDRRREELRHFATWGSLKAVFTTPEPTVAEYPLCRRNS